MVERYGVWLKRIQSIRLLAPDGRQQAEIQRLMSLNAELLAACKLQQDAMDMLFAQLVVRSPPGDTFYPSQSGPPWAAMRVGAAAIDRAEGRRR